MNVNAIIALVVLVILVLIAVFLFQRIDDGEGRDNDAREKERITRNWEM
jgi:hypothetical protein